MFIHINDDNKRALLTNQTNDSENSSDIEDKRYESFSKPYKQHRQSKYLDPH